MANEIMVPLLPCRSIDEIADFYGMLGFTQTYYQARPYPCVGLKRDDIQMQFFGMPDFKAEDSYGSCLVIVPDTGELYRSFADGMRRVHGKVLVSGIPRMTRPRKRKNADDRSGFSVIDPGGNWIRVFAATIERDAQEPAPGTLGALLRNAVVMGDSKGDHVRAAEILDGAIARNAATASATDLVEALAYRAELALRADDTDTASAAVARARGITMSAGERAELAETLGELDDLASMATTAQGA
jgi:hypothetical protein